MPVVAVAPVVLVGAGVVPSASADAGASASAATRADEAMHTFKFFMWLLRKFLCTIRMTRYTRIFSAFLSDMDYLVSPYADTIIYILNKYRVWSTYSVNAQKFERPLKLFSKSLITFLQVNYYATQS